MKQLLSSFILLYVLLCAQPAFAQMDQLHTSHGHTKFQDDRFQKKKMQVANGVELEYVEQGVPGGIPVIFLHGYTDSWLSFKSVLAQLPENIHAFAISQRGHGNSARPLNNYHPRDFAKDIAVFIKKNKLPKVLLVGHSMGGVIAQQFALRYPVLLRGLVLVSTDACLANNPGLPDLQQAVMSLTDPVNTGFIHEFQQSTCHQPVEQNYYAQLVAESGKLPAHVWKAAMLGFMSVDFTPELNNIQQPTLVAWGDKDSFMSRADQEVLVNGIPGAKLLVYEETGHALHWERPAQFAADLVGFLQQLSGKEGVSSSRREQSQGPETAEDTKNL